MVLRRAKPKGFLEWIDFIFTGTSKHSVSKINQLISLYIAFMWLVLVYNSRGSWQVSSWPLVEQAVLMLTILAALGIVVGARTYTGSHGHTVDEHESFIIEKEANK